MGFTTTPGLAFWKHQVIGYVKHLTVVTGLGMTIMFSVYNSNTTNFEAKTAGTCGVFLTTIYYLTKVAALLALPFTLCNFLGILIFHTFPAKPKLKVLPSSAPFICFRVVTRGQYPNLVCGNVEHNLRVCRNVGIADHCMIEVVTDHPINLPYLPNTREVVVPMSYRTANGTLYKARALQYCLEPSISVLKDLDWIVHLDEETLLTDDAVRSIVNFVSMGKYPFGQGIITYASIGVVNWVTTLADSIRVGIDYGSIRFTLGVLHRPVFSWKGSYVVANAGVEKLVSFDNGPEGSITEDWWFAMRAASLGYGFNFIEGEMHERSPFTLVDYIKQRKRWMQGIYLVSRYCCVPWRYKLGVHLMVWGWVLMPLSTLGIPLSMFYSLPMYTSVNVLLKFILAVFVFLFIFGTAMSMKLTRIWIPKCCLLCAFSILVIPVAIILESIAVLLGMLSCKNASFYIVDKEWPPRVTTK